MFSEKPIEAKQTQTFLQKLKEFDFEPIAHQLMQSGWTHQQTMRAITHYKIFLLLIYLYPHTPLAPTQEIDQVWHCHILHTRKYREDCQMLFGYFIDHEPNLKIRQKVEGRGQKDEAEFSSLCYVLPVMVSNLKIGHLQRSACGRPESSLRKIFQLSVSQC